MVRLCLAPEAPRATSETVILQSETTIVGFFAKLLNAFVMLPLGLLAVLISIVVLWTNEGLPLYGELAEESVAVDAGDVDSATPGTLVSVTGPLTTSGSTSDPDYIAADDYIRIIRSVEQFAWHEVTEVTEERKLGGRTERTTTWEYEAEWTTEPTPTEFFRTPEGHLNPPMTTFSDRFDAGEVTVGSWQLESPDLLNLPGSTRLRLADATLIGRGETADRHGNWLYLNGANPDSPEIGDERITFWVVHSGATATAFGSATGDGKLAPHALPREGFAFYEVMSGGREGAIATLHTEDHLRLLLLRTVGFGIMWFGFWLVLSIVYVIFDIVPVLGTIVRVIGAILTLPVAVAGTSITVGLSVIAHNGWWTATVLSSLMAVIGWLYYLRPWVTEKLEQSTAVER